MLKIIAFRIFFSCFLIVSYNVLGSATNSVDELAVSNLRLQQNVQVNRKDLLSSVAKIPFSTFTEGGNRLRGGFKDKGVPSLTSSQGLIGTAKAIVDQVGHPNFLSPHSKPIGILPSGTLIYVVNTPADTVEVIDAASGLIIDSINVGIDPVSVAVRPDGKEVWVANHISDSVSVIDSDPSSPTFHHVIATVQSFDEVTRSTQFDEPVGMAFANNDKVYISLSSENKIAIVDVSSRAVTGSLSINAQDPRAIVVKGKRLYVIPFESGNRTELAGCFTPIDGDQCTFDLQKHVVDTTNVLSLGYDADIVRDPRVPDRDLFIFDTDTDELIEVVSTIGTLLYGITSSSKNKIYIALTEARNDSNGRAGTLKHKLVDLQNRAFLNQIAMIDCRRIPCSKAKVFELEPLPPEKPLSGLALSTPFGIQISDDDTTLVVSAAGSNKLFTVDSDSGQVLGRVDVGWVPRGVALQSNDDGAPLFAWVLNAVANSVSQVDVSNPSEPFVMSTIQLEDPTHPLVKLGRAAFNSANASSTGTFSCESCHPDGNTDQLLWVLDGPQCGLPGCDQIPPRSTMPIRGLRDTAPYHWDGLLGDPIGGRNGQYPRGAEPPNCSDAKSCTRQMLDSALASTMCDQTNCTKNEKGQAGLLTERERDAMATFLLSVPYPPGRKRPFDDKVTELALEGFDLFFSNNNRPTCGQAGCHQLPFWSATNGPGSGMDAPTFRGLPDRWLITPQGRHNIFDLLTTITSEKSDVPWNPEKGFDELSMWAFSFGTAENPRRNRVITGYGPMAPWQMFLEASMGFSGAFARQITLNKNAISAENIARTLRLMSALEDRANDGVIILQGEGIVVVGNTSAEINLNFKDGEYFSTDGRYFGNKERLLGLSARGLLTITLTGRLGENVDVDHPQPALWLEEESPLGIHRFPTLSDNEPVYLKGRHVIGGSQILIDGQSVMGSINCVDEGELPLCKNNRLLIQLKSIPEGSGLHLMQVQTPKGLLSNEYLIYVD